LIVIPDSPLFNPSHLGQPLKQNFHFMGRLKSACHRIEFMFSLDHHREPGRVRTPRQRRRPNFLTPGTFTFQLALNGLRNTIFFISKSLRVEVEADGRRTVAGKC
jgi:hypothetical protein